MKYMWKVAAFKKENKKKAKVGKMSIEEFKPNAEMVFLRKILLSLEQALANYCP